MHQEPWEVRSISSLQETGRVVWGSQAAGTWGGNLLHLAEAGVELPTELDQAASRAVRSAPPLFRRSAPARSSESLRRRANSLSLAASFSSLSSSAVSCAASTRRRSAISVALAQSASLCCLFLRRRRAISSCCPVPALRSAASLAPLAGGTLVSSFCWP